MMFRTRLAVQFSADAVVLKFRVMRDVVVGVLHSVGEVGGGMSKRERCLVFIWS